MKYIVVLGDGMADEPIEALEGRTPLEAAKTPTLDELAGKSEIGLAYTIPEGMKPGSDTANLSVMGYDPKLYYIGHSPLEALSIGVDMKADDIALRTNLITVSDGEEPYEEKIIIDHSSSEISTEDARILLDAVRAELEDDIYKFYAGTSDRHLLIWAKGEVVELTPPHDVLGQRVGGRLHNSVGHSRKPHLVEHTVKVSRIGGGHGRGGTYDLRSAAEGQLPLPRHGLHRSNESAFISPASEYLADHV